MNDLTTLANNMYLDNLRIAAWIFAGLVVIIIFYILMSSPTRIR